MYQYEYDDKNREIYEAKMIDNFLTSENSKSYLYNRIVNGYKGTPQRILDIGCANDWLALEIMKNKECSGNEYIGVDLCLNSTNIIYDEKKNNTIYLKGESATVYLDELNKEKHKHPELVKGFDIIILSSVLHEIVTHRNIDTANDIIDQCYNLLGPNGVLFIRDGVSLKRKQQYPLCCNFDGMRCKFKIPTEDLIYYLMYFKERNHIYRSYNLEDLIKTFSDGNLYKASFVKDFLGAYTWGKTGFWREAEQCHFLFSKEEWEVIATRYNGRSDIRSIDISFYDDEYKKYIEKLVEWDEYMNNIFEYNTVIIEITKKEDDFTVWAGINKKIIKE